MAKENVSKCWFIWPLKLLKNDILRESSSNFFYVNLEIVILSVVTYRRFGNAAFFRVQD